MNLQSVKPRARLVWGIGWLVHFPDAPKIAAADHDLLAALRKVHWARLNLLTARNGA